MRIFLTGASGCIGHYLAEALIQETKHELFLLVRNPNKLKFDYKARPGIAILQGNLQEIENYSELLKTIEVAILAATSWGGAVESFEINVLKTICLIELLDPKICEQVIYFSTASILDSNNNLLKEAGEIGTDYIRTKYECYSRLSKLALASKITKVFPTLVFGGDENKPYSHIAAGLPDVVKWIGLIRWFKADGSFHFIHARDIAQIIRYLVDNPPSEASNRQFVLGYQQTTVNEAIEEICAYFNKRIYFRIPLYVWLANFFIAVFRVQMAAWDRFLLNNRHSTYQNITSPESFGLMNYCCTVTDILKTRGISQTGI
ncbi:nucleoside-diphosphate-sugar epimerase [Pleurocapsa sp. PCC 7327]|uniref:NAD-dependent epimerase/dehydratase family protein n=1 Tax=Pleurocapsa sp. PCC 7327 TaxID=118163 RepID=UPI00029F955B|nr:NAD(P)-dependent oxidoreductase [Pleurocapsa sp. PCC 7327]AFY79453.1 nucleoside-diphosphate-sugar epimerase [Pleurocapsa sp. PCC 7327]